IGDFVDFEPIQYNDNLAFGRHKLLQFVLTNVRGRSVSAGQAGFLGMFTIETTPEEAQTPKMSLTYYGCQARWDRKEDDWAQGKWKREGTIEIGFLEPFRVLSKGDDFYFLTRSGSLYRAPKPAKGTHRKMERVWADPREPITAFITDVDNGKTYL